jgi:hypothetical protein
MNKLFLIGNGFDLAHNLKTGYKDFIIWYFNQAIDSYVKNGQYSDQYFIHRIIKLPPNCLRVTSIEEIHSLSRKGERGNFINLLGPLPQRIIDDLSSNNWVDLEIIYYQVVLEEIRRVDTDLKTKIRSIEWFNKSLEFLKEKLIEYLKSIEIPNKNINIENHFLKEFNKNRKEKERAEIQKQIFLSNEMTYDILFVSFNYTNLLSRYKNSGLVLYGLKIDFINIHGSLEDLQNPIIFGYGDEMEEHYKTIENFNENEFLKNMKSFGYFQSQYYKTILNFINDSEFEVHLMGHSCGISDRVLLNSIFEHRNCKSIQIYYHKKSETENNFKELTMNISRHFNKKQLMRDRIVPFNLCLPLS